MPETTLANASALAGELCRQIAAHTVTFQSTRFTVTSSMGVAELSNEDAGPDAFFHRADAALFRAKRAGGNGAKS
jgi:PleD family two-component response regulator